MNDLNIFFAAPTSPPDGSLYMDGQTSIPCDVPGGVQQMLIGPAVICLLVYSIAIPLTAAFFLRAKRRVIKYDQLLRAKDLGFDRLTNKYFGFRRMWSRLYQNYKPGKLYWELLIVVSWNIANASVIEYVTKSSSPIFHDQGRKFLIAVTALMFRTTPSYQLAMALLGQLCVEIGMLLLSSSPKQPRSLIMQYFLRPMSFTCDIYRTCLMPINPSTFFEPCPS